MSIFFILISIIQSFAISLGVGASTLAIINFFVAISDSKIDPTERKMMGVVYAVLRVAMAVILLTTIALLALATMQSGSVFNLSSFAYSQLTVIGILYLNAMLMTAHLMPSTFGPSIQAGSWYALGLLAALGALGLTNFTYLESFLTYITWILLMTAFVNGMMAVFKAKKLGIIKK